MTIFGGISSSARKTRRARVEQIHYAASRIFNKEVKPRHIPELNKVAEAKGLKVGMPVKDAETGKPLGTIKKIDSRAVYIRGQKRHPNTVVPV